MAEESGSILAEERKRGEVYARGDASGDSPGGCGLSPIEGEHRVQPGVVKKLPGFKFGKSWRFDEAIGELPVRCAANGIELTAGSWDNVI